jgi:FKBP-type peptidyl-prolyl cis-trans isomerase
MLSSESGLIYKILNNSNSGIKIKEGSEVVIAYDIRLMDSFQTKCYSSDSTGLAKFIVQHSTIESGIDEVVTYLEKNDSALVILPQYIAHGVSGDSKLIPPLSTVLYFIKIVDVK